jgi:peptidoglycan/xylan/chitin deacetylase (PgdA/CDA1 family)
VQPQTINLTFHGIGEPERSLDDGEADVWLNRDGFEAVLDAVGRRDDVRITFDDGNASDVVHALPALRERGLTATFFVVAGRLGTPGFLDEAGVGELAAAGMAIGCHGMRHRAWRRLDEPSLHEELVGAKTMLEAIVRRPVTEAACPFGSYDRRVLSALRRSGYRHVYTSDRGPARRGDWLQARNTVQRADGPELIGRILGSRGALRRRARLTAKRWR